MDTRFKTARRNLLKESDVDASIRLLDATKASNIGRCRKKHPVEDNWFNVVFPPGSPVEYGRCKSGSVNTFAWVRCRDAETGLYTADEVDTQRVFTMVPLEYFFSAPPEQVDGFVHRGSSATQEELQEAESELYFFAHSFDNSSYAKLYLTPPSAVQQGAATESAPPASATPAKRKRAASDDSIPNARQQHSPPGRFAIAHAEQLLYLLRQAPARSVSDCFKEIGF
ncbi:hypothetical protein CYMTET_9477 [Cymbomonas tetramitiformis]|uniref:Uncharacterized protein n=1 Tax=Cymbomonas tetramitiformis TaxID=36881 RepID=A0AAE0GSP7_9CHLO|nr:hypothetical protein CYMTET_9477 [Cymbomonas tetramitiformis]